MQFVEPFLLWGALAVAIPVAIHFWHQKQGKTLPWAATQWLIKKQQQQSRGFRLDNVPLLIIRCLLLILLAFLLAQPILNWFQQPPAIQKVHLVQPSQAVADNYKFELTDARKKGEKVIWADERLSEMDDKPIAGQPFTRFSTLQLQTAINRLDTKNTELHLYLVNNQKLAGVPAISVPAKFSLHTVVDSSAQPRPYLVVKNERKLFINRTGKLVSLPTLDPTLKFKSAPAHSGPIAVLLRYQKAQEQQTVKAAVAALADVYGFDFSIDEKLTPNRSYDWILTDKQPLKPSVQTLYTVSDMAQIDGQTNVTFTNESLTPQTSDRAATGQLPEWLGLQLLHHYGLSLTNASLSASDLKFLFVPTNKPTTEQHAGIQHGLFLLFVSLLAVERWIALTKNA
ncbi:BatA domain-containing protein [Spirosoma sp.]|uniref:BatA domain-containing protein n=1 Tax=Spirosoma sp. TaxID=1899569 RepID=UPI00260BF04C|nr:BatA domain-containing protein [Spirosoma sp.]MCX6215116.1 BatA domain-containing protein [Spirosoma sp.]